MSSNIHVITHSGLDGMGCLLVMLWVFSNDNITFSHVYSKTDLLEELKKKSLNSYDKVFILNLNISAEHLPYIDRPNVIYVSHRNLASNIVLNKAKKITKPFSSSVLYTYNLFKSQLSNISNAQKQLIAQIHDYESNQLQFKSSIELSKLFKAHYTGNSSLFIKDFYNGAHKLTKLQLQALEIYDRKVTDTIDNLIVFEATAFIQGASRYIIAAFAEYADEIANFLAKKYNPDVVILVDTKKFRVNFKCNTKVNIDASILCQLLCDGGGHESAAEGSLTEKFMTFSKLFQPIKYASS